MWFGNDWVFEAGFVATLIYSVPKSLAVQYLEPETHVRLHSCGFFFSFPSCISKEIPGCHEAFSQKQSYNGNFRHAWRPEDADPWGKGEAELWKGSRRECADGAPLQGALFIHSDQRQVLPLVQCREGKGSTPPPTVPGRLNSLLQACPRNYWTFPVLPSPNLILRAQK